MSKNKKIAKSAKKEVPPSKIIPQSPFGTQQITPQQLIESWKNRLAIIAAQAHEATNEIQNSMIRTIVELVSKVEKQSKDLKEKEDRIKDLELRLQQKTKS